MAIAFVSLLVVVIVTIIGIPILARVFKEATDRGQDTTDGDSGHDEERGSKG